MSLLSNEEAEYLRKTLKEFFITSDPFDNNSIKEMINFCKICVQNSNYVDQYNLLHIAKFVLLKRDNKCGYNGLRFNNNSCYIDSLLVVLLITPTTFVNDNIFFSEVEKNVDHFSVCGSISNKENKRKMVKMIQKEMRDLAIDMRYNIEVNKCTAMRDMIRNCTGNDIYKEGSTADPAELLNTIFTIFNINTMSEIETVYYTNGDSDVYVGRNVINKPPVIQVNTVIDGYNLYRAISNPEQDMIEGKKFFTHGGNNYRYIKKNISYPAVNFIVFHINRKIYDEKTSKLVYNNVLINIPNGFLHRNENIYLYAIIEFIPKYSHYIAYYRCDNRWLRYDDMENQVVETDIPESARRNCVLVFYKS